MEFLFMVFPTVSNHAPFEFGILNPSGPTRTLGPQPSWLPLGRSCGGWYLACFSSLFLLGCRSRWCHALFRPKLFQHVFLYLYRHRLIYRLYFSQKYVQFMTLSHSSDLFSGLLHATVNSLLLCAGESPNLRKGTRASGTIEAAMERRKREAYAWLGWQLSAGEHDENSQRKPRKIIRVDPCPLAARKREGCKFERVARKPRLAIWQQCIKVCQMFREEWLVKFFLGSLLNMVSMVNMMNMMNMMNMTWTQHEHNMNITWI
jgi:hypothetical protein